MATRDDIDRRFDTVATYPTAIAAELAASALREEGIEAQVRDANVSSVMPHLAAALGNVRVDVPVEDAARAHELLRQIDRVDTDDLTDDPRCPACDSTYLAERKNRMECQRCGHRFAHEDAGEPRHGALQKGYRGRAERPAAGHDVFLLRQNSKGMGMFIGLLAGFAFALLVAREGPGFVWLLLLGPALGWMVGRRWVYYVCSDPQCRARLRSHERRCPGCRGIVRGEIARAADHWVERAARRRGGH